MSELTWTTYGYDEEESDRGFITDHETIYRRTEWNSRHIKADDLFAYSPCIATIPAAPCYVLGVAGKPIGTVEHPSLDAARAEAKRLANKERVNAWIYIAGDPLPWESVPPDPPPAPRTLQCPLRAAIDYYEKERPALTPLGVAMVEICRREVLREKDCETKRT